MLQFRYYTKLLATPLLLLFAFVSLTLLWELVDLPSAAAFMVLVENWFQEWGLGLVFGAAFLEGLLLVGNYFPGSFVLLLAVTMTSSPGEAVGILLIASGGLLLAHSFNYGLGRYGWYTLLVKLGLEDSIAASRERLLKRGVWAIFGSYCLPSLAAVVDTAAGILRLSLQKFLFVAVLALLFWNSILTIIAYNFRDQALTVMSSDTSIHVIIPIVLVLWMLGILVADWRRQKHVVE